MYVQLSVYIVEGTALFIAGGIVVAAFLKTRQLFKQYPLILVQQLTTALIGVAMFSAGVGRIIILKGESTELKSARFCMLMPWNLIFIWAEPLVPVMFLVTSFDRLLSLVAPMSYFKNGFRLQIIQITVSHGIVAALVIEAWIETLSDIEPNKDNVCWTSDGMRGSHVTEFFYIRVITSMLSVVLYIIAYLLLRIKTAKTEHFGQAQRIFEERQRQLTLTMLISCFFTIVLYVIPVTAIFINDSISVPVLNSFINWYAILSGDTNCLVIILIIYFKQPDIAKAIKSVLRRPFTQVKSFNQSGVITVS